FNGDGCFGIGQRTQAWKDLTTCILPEKYDDFFEFAFAAVGDRLTAYVNGRKILEAREEAPLDRSGTVGLGTLVSYGEFRDIEVQVLDKLPVQEQAFVPLFNGKDLTGWQPLGPREPNAWTIQQGVLVGHSDNWASLRTVRADYGDFHLRVEAMVDGP